MIDVLKKMTDEFMPDLKLPGPVIDSIRKIGFTAKPPSAIYFSMVPQIDDNTTFHFTQPPTDEETNKEVETLPPIDLTNLAEVEMPSSPWPYECRIQL
jgi:hypothetical protein